MAIRPKVHRNEVSRAIAMIAQRRAQIDDPSRENLPDSPDSDPREVLDYLRHHSRTGIPNWVLQADVCDALTINNWLWWEDRRRELHFLRAGIERGLFLSQLGSQVGVGKQGVKDRIDRLDALLRYDRPDEAIIRQERRAQREGGEHGTHEEAWLAAHQNELAAVTTALVTQAGQYRLKETEREWLDELAADANDDVCTPGTMIILGLAVAELRTAPAVLALTSDRPHKVHATLTQADILRSQFAELGTKTPANTPKATRRPPR